MPKRVKELSDAEVRRLARKQGVFAVGGVAGLHLQSDPPACSWILKKKIGDQRPRLGLGPYPEITLAMARQKAREYAEMIREGIDPRAERKARESALRASQAKQQTFRDVAQRYIAKKAKEYRTAKQVQKLTSQLNNYVYPTVGKMLVSDIERPHILAILEPLWESKHETAKHIRSNVERILDMATVEGLRTGINPATWKGNLALSLAKSDKVANVQHYKSLPVTDLPEFIQKLLEKEAIGARALHFTILTAARSGETRGATWDEIDLDNGVWTIPGERMKAGRDHRVPLCQSAVDLLKSLPRESSYIFPNRKGKPLSDMTMGQIPRRMGYPVTVHGFRATFRTWTQEHTSYPDEVCELALAHVNSDATRAAYARSELIDKRRKLMNDWEHFCYHGLPKGDVVPMRGKA